MYNLYNMLYMMRKIEMYGVGKVGPKGQVVIPAEARDELGFKPGDKVVVAGMSPEKSVIIMSEETFQKHLEHMRRHYDALGQVLKYQTRYKTKQNNDETL